MPSLTSRPDRPAAWAGLIALSAALVALSSWIGLPAPILLGAMFAAAILAVRGHGVRLPKLSITLAQAVLGLMIADMIPATIWAELARDWWLIGLIIAAVISASFGIGWWLAEGQILPGTTAIWGAAPGAASAMVLMSEQSDADARLVAFMQYLRMMMVATIASFVARFMLGPSAAVEASLADAVAASFGPVALWPSITTMLVAVAGIALARLAGLPALTMILPMVFGIAGQATGMIDVTLHPLLLGSCYMLFGWSVGLRFDQAIVRHALKALPRLALATLALIALCALMGLAIAQLTGMDLLTAYLATSPGGADAIAIIAVASPVDKPFVLAVQTLRFMVVLIVGPALARLLTARFAARRATPGEPS